MKREVFDKAKLLIEKSESLEKIIKKHKLGWDDGKPEFIDESSDFYGANFLNVKIIETTISTGGGSSMVPRIAITENSDGSGAKYHLSKKEIKDLQYFILSMLTEKLLNAREELEKL